jgi:hypothetical protein
MPGFLININENQELCQVKNLLCDSVIYCFMKKYYCVGCGMAYVFEAFGPQHVAIPAIYSGCNLIGKSNRRREKIGTGFNAVKHADYPDIGGKLFRQSLVSSRKKTPKVRTFRGLYLSALMDERSI